MDESQKNQAMVTSLRLLAASPKSQQEVMQRLESKGYSREVIRKTVSELTRQGLIDDLSYGKNLLQKYKTGAPSGRRKIAFEMKRRGIPVKIREELLGQISQGEEFERARELAAARWERLKANPPPKRRKNVYDFLIRRGFDFTTARDIIEELSSESDL